MNVGQYESRIRRRRNLYSAEGGETQEEQEKQRNEETKTDVDEWAQENPPSTF